MRISKIFKPNGEDKGIDLILLDDQAATHASSGQNAIVPPPVAAIHRQAKAADYSPSDYGYAPHHGPQRQFALFDLHPYDDVQSTFSGYQPTPNDFKDPQFIVVNYLHDICKGSGWLRFVDPLEPCVLKKSAKKGNEISYRYLPPSDHIAPQSFVDCCARYIRADVAVRLSFPVVHSIMGMLELTTRDVISLDDNNNIQIIDTIADLQWVRKYQYCAFVRELRSLVVWGESVNEVTEYIRALETRMVDFVWTLGSEVQVHDSASEQEIYESKEEIPDGVVGDEKSIESNTEGVQVVTQKMEDSSSDEKLPEVAAVDIERQEVTRPIVYNHAIIQLISLLILMVWLGSYSAAMTRMVRAESNYYSLLGILYFPPSMFISSFFATSVVMVVSYIIGPVSQVTKNSHSYSVNPAPRLTAKNGILPHVTIQCPVYKERLETVLKPTFQSLQKAIHTYELQGGSANIFVNDDGLQIIDRDEALARIEFYEENNIGYVARPEHGKDGFVRKGRFKKASNMNYCLHISRMVDAKFHAALAEKELWTAEEESAVYLDSLEKAIAEDGRCWAGGDILVGEIILLIDSDTRVPEDCFVDSVSEMYHSPDVAIIQHASGVMMVVNNFWEQLLAWFTDMIYFSISVVSANGADTASFVGHNAFLRWSAIQECAYLDEDDGLTKYWSELHVSEDFEMSLKLAGLGYVIRVATYHNAGFKEGVSLTVYDEITRWSKYAFGCAEIMFHPVKDWWKGRVFTSLFCMFLKSNISVPTKYSILGYMGTYFAISSSLFLLVANYFIVGYYNWGYAAIYIDSMTVFVAVMVVFGIASQVAYCIARYRMFRKNFLVMLLEFKWSVLFCVYMGGLSWHMVVSITSYFFSLPLLWGATAKDIDDSNFFKEVPKAMKNYRYMYVICILLVGMMVSLAFFVPYQFKIRMLIVALPLGWSVTCHFLAPIVLNAQLMTFAW